MSRSYRERTGKWAKAESPPSAARHEQFSAIEYEYKPPSVEDSSDTDSVLPIDDSAGPCGTVIHTPRRNKNATSPVANESISGSDDSAEIGGTIIHTPHHNKRIAPPAANQSALGFDPLSSFTVHQTDKPAEYERSYIDHRAYPTTVRQVHGSLSLHNEKLIKAITDATGGELDWDTIKDLDISGKGLTSLHGLDKYCASLLILNVDNNEIEHLDGCPSKLRVLSANNNHLSSMTSWAHLTHLCRVNATDNKLRHLDGLAELFHLTELDVSRNRINNINGLAFLTELRKLNVSDNFLERVPWSKWLLTRLVDLDMSHNMLYTIDSLDALPRLEILDLEKNEINSFSDDAKRSHVRLREINLKKNNIMSFDFSMFPILQDLNLDENLIMSAASLRELSKARSLIKLSLRAQQESCQGHENRLLDTMINTRGHFQELYLSENETSYNKGHVAMPSNFKHCNIRVLEMASCGITRLPRQFGQYFPACHTMNLNHNSIDDITELRGLEAVEKLLMARNRLNKPKSVAYLRLPELRILDLRENVFNQDWYNTMRGARAERPREYPPGTTTPGDFELPGRVDDLKSRWFKRLPETVQHKRLFINLLLAISCPTLMEFDGAEWNGQVYLNHKDFILQSLNEYGMLSGKSSHVGNCTQNSRARDFTQSSRVREFTQ